MAKTTDVVVDERPSYASTSLGRDELLPASAFDPALERRIVRKVDWTLIPPLWLLFLVSFFDRSNIGNAEIAGMDKSLHLTGHRYNIAVMVFTLAYVVFGVPANIVFRRFGPRTLGIMMFAWGLCALGQGLVQTYQGLVALRLLMGVFEAGFVPGCAYLIGSYYKRDEFLRRYSVFFSAAIAAGAFNGLLSTLLAKANGAGGLAGWRWIFLVEGIVTCVFSVGAFFFMLPFPENATMFSPREKEILLERLRRDGGQVDHDQLGSHVFQALTDWKIWAMMFAYIGAEENASAVVAFQPTVLKGLGFQSTQAQVHSIPIYCVALVLSLLCAQLSDRLHQRALFAFIGTLFTMVGLGIEIAQPHSVAVRYAGMFFITSGAYITMPIIVVWSAINASKGYKRVVSFGLVIASGNAGALVSSNVFLANESPHYHTGFSVGIGMNCLTVVCIALLALGFAHANRKKDKLAQTAQLEMGHQGEMDRDFRFQL